MVTEWRHASGDRKLRALKTCTRQVPTALAKIFGSVSVTRISPPKPGNASSTLISTKLLTLTEPVMRNPVFDKLRRRVRRDNPYNILTWQSLRGHGLALRQHRDRSPVKLDLDRYGAAKPL